MRVGWIGFDVSLGVGMAGWVSTLCIQTFFFFLFKKRKFENPIKLSFILIPKNKFMKMIFRKLSQTDLDSS